jgi:16S rRNA (guanine527-N7)-methyltransferase
LVITPLYHRSRERAFGYFLKMEWEALPGLFPGLAEPARWLPLLRHHLDLVLEAERHTRVTAVAPAEAVQRHYAESLEIWRIAVEGVGRIPETVIDVGSGGGFPGLVMACVAPATEFILVEPLKKRAHLLEEFVDKLGLTNVAVHAARAEEAGRGALREAGDLVTARAVAALPELLEYTVPLARAGGMIALPKGSGLAEELAAASNALVRLDCRVVAQTAMRPEVSATLAVVLLEKLGPTSAAYPRRPGMPSKRPL